VALLSAQSEFRFIFEEVISMTHLRLCVPTLLMLAALAIATACNTATQPAQPAAPPDTRAADEAAIRAADAEWVKAIATKDIQQSTSYYADTAQLFAPNAPAAQGKDAIQKAFTGLLAMPDFALTFGPTQVEVSRSGDLAYETGNYELTTNDKKGKPQTTKAKYVVVWGKQPNGTWKALVDSPTTTTP
jgi:uncharacterized protein (TIGR02246 family)